MSSLVTDLTALVSMERMEYRMEFIAHSKPHECFTYCVQLADLRKLVFMHKLGVQLVHKPELWLSIIRSKRTQVTELWQVFFLQFYASLFGFSQL